MPASTVYGVLFLIKSQENRGTGSLQTESEFKINSFFFKL